MPRRKRLSHLEAFLLGHIGQNHMEAGGNLDVVCHLAGLASCQGRLTGSGPEARPAGPRTGFLRKPSAE